MGKELLKARNINNSDDFRFWRNQYRRQVLGNLFSNIEIDLPLAITGRYNRHERMSTRMDNLLLDVDRLLSCDATLSIGKWFTRPRQKLWCNRIRKRITMKKTTLSWPYGATGHPTEWLYQSRLQGRTAEALRERWKRFTGGVIAADFR